MRNLKEDLEEVETAKLKAWVRRKRRRAGLVADEPATWFVYVDQRRPHFERAVQYIGRSAGDALYTAQLEADINGYHQESTGRWLIERLGLEGQDSPYLIVVPEYDPDGYPPHNGEEQ